MSRLLVSVRNSQEASIARRAGVSIIDVKEPHKGSLGAASIETIQRVAEQCDESTKLSVALGELVDLSESIDFINSVPRLDFVKLGLSKTTKLNWRQTWLRTMSVIRPSIGRVLVAYADASVAESPPVSELLEFGIEQQVPTFLVDTFSKTNGNLFSHLSFAFIAKLTHDAAAAGIDVAIAGSIDEAAIARLTSLSPAIIAVRGAVCRGGRTGEIDYDMIKSLQASLAHAHTGSVP